MGYDLKPRNKKLGNLHLSGGTWPTIAQSFGMYFDHLITRNGYVSWDKSYPYILYNDGYRVSASDARILSRMARNFAKLQSALPDTWNEENINHPYNPGRDLLKCSDSITNSIKEFANWAERSRGFRIC